jgi:transposase
MISYEDYMQIKIMRKQGQSLRAIACELGCAVNTVRKNGALGHPQSSFEHLLR